MIDWKEVFIKYVETLDYREGMTWLYKEDWSDEEWEEIKIFLSSRGWSFNE